MADCVAKLALRHRANRDSVVSVPTGTEAVMMGRLDRGRRQLFYAFNLEEVVPQDHLVRGIAEVLDLS